MLLLALGQFFVHKKNPANLVLIGVFVLCCVWLTHATWYMLGFAQNYPHINKTYLPFFCLTGPMWYLYLKCLFDQYQPRNRDAVYLIPSLICILLSIPFYSQSAEFKNNYVETDLYNFTTYAIYLATRLAELTAITSLVFSLLYLRDLDKSFQLNRDQWSIKLFMGITFTALLAGIIRLFGSVAGSHTFSVLVPCSIICIVFVSIYCLSHRYPLLLNLGFPTPKSKSSFPQHNHTLDNYRQIITNEQWYLDPDIKMQRLAELLNTQAHRLSELINTSAGTNFNGFINDFRIEHAKKILISEPQRSILDIAFTSGFNSKSAFYNHFTLNTSMTPSEYRKSFQSLSS